MKWMLVAAALACLHDTISARKINGWYPCNLRTFATPAPATTTSSTGQAMDDESPTIRGWRLNDQDPANAIFRSLIVNPATDMSITLGAAAAAPTVECAEITMPLCHEGICESNATITVFVKRMRAAPGRNTAAAKSLWVLQGGPGASSVNMEGIMAALYDAPGSYLGGSVDVYTMDHRGTGRSSRLSCVASQVETSGSPTKGHFTSQSFPDCIQDVNMQLGDDADVNLLKAYSTTSAATDLSKIISLLNTTPNAHTTVYGVSYGTYLVQRLMQLANPSVKGYVLDGVVSQSGSKSGEKLSFADWAVNMDEIGTAFMALCAKDATCGPKFATSSLQETLKALYTSMDSKGPKGTTCSSFLTSVGGSSLTPPSYTLRQLLGHLLQVQSIRNFIPVLVYRLSRCNPNDATAVANFVTAYLNIIGAPDESDAYDSSMLYNLVALSELFTYPAPSRPSLRASFAGSLIASDTSSLVTMYCLASNGKDAACASEKPSTKPGFQFIYPTDKYFDVAIAIPNGTSVLLLSGLLDPQTPPKFARYQLASFVGTAKRLIEFPTSAHGTILNTPVTVQNKVPCGASIVSSFVMAGGLDKLDTTCLEYLTPNSFAITTALGQRLMATDDVYEGTPRKAIVPRTPSDSAASDVPASTKPPSESQVNSSWRSLAIAAVVVAAVIFLVMVVVVMRLRRQVREAKDLSAEYIVDPVEP
ncbi:hypothetical protein DYB26_009430 [Aphanomyces astaci]|uniref:AB hydrolase-1 domain-containing protein n=1 Tax=Aphanomyces astaci TaxID=112090 RepID=A0A418E9D8_APHAT|nr:hypothetical protein DYB26_009430 [Aphanomyces astaci]